MCADPGGRRTYRFGCQAMGTRFGLTLVCHDATLASEMAQMAFDEVRRVERELSRFVPASDANRIRALREGESVRIGTATYECLRTAGRICRETNGAFDVTIGALREAWLNEDGSLRSPAPAELEEARARCGMEKLHLHGGENAVTALADGIVIDFGGIGKGCAVDVVADLLAGWEPDGALIHGGESTVTSLGRPSEGEWTVALRAPGTGEALAELPLGVDALSGSGTHLHGPHIIDPRTGRPEARHEATWAFAAHAVQADALSTAFMVMDTGEIEDYCARHPGVSAAVLDGPHLPIQHFRN
jgi:thiamine biosynthesis lipoprotein